MKTCPFHKKHWLYSLLGIHACELSEPVQCYQTLAECKDCCCFCKVYKGDCWKEVAMTNVEKIFYYNWQNNTNESGH